MEKYILIENARKTMEELIKRKKYDLSDPAVIEASKNLDSLLNIYNKMIFSK